VEESKNTIFAEFKQDMTALWQRSHWFLAIFVIAMLCDGLSTIHFMLTEGVEKEMHIAVRCLSITFGPVAGPLIGAFGKIVTGIIVGAYCKKFANYIYTAASILSFAAAWYNIWGIKIFAPQILRWIPW